MFWLRNKKVIFFYALLTKVLLNVLKALFSFRSQIKMLVLRAGNHKLLFRIANRVDPALFLSRPFWQGIYWLKFKNIYHNSHGKFLFVFVDLRPKSTAMVIAGRSVHLTTLFSWASLNK